MRTLPVLMLAACLSRLSAADGVAVEHDGERRETKYTITEGDCRISWTAFESEANRAVIRHQADCRLAPAAQARLIETLLRRVMQDGDGARFRTLDWGRLYPDRARDLTLPARLAQAAARSPQWDRSRGAPRTGDINGWVRSLANDAEVYGELRAAFRRAGLDIRMASVEKVLVMRAGKLPFFPRLDGVKPGDKVPFDCQAWFSVYAAK